MRDDGVLALLGGVTVLGADVTTDVEFAAAVERGLPTASIDAFLSSLASAGIRGSTAGAALLAFVGPLQALHPSGGALSPAESACLVRLARRVVRAEEVFGAREPALRWFITPNRALHGLQPTRLVSTDAGAAIIDQLLGRIEHGVFS